MYETLKSMMGMIPLLTIPFEPYGLKLELELMATLPSQGYHVTTDN
jgi:hypothetical protein